jgi:hypothetical protein
VFTSSKTFYITLGLYTLTVFLPSLSVEPGLAAPEESIEVAVIACALFVLGVLFGAHVFKFTTGFAPPMESRGIQAGFGTGVLLLVLATAYVLVTGPTSPLIAALGTDDSLQVALMREDAVKLNPDKLFVRVYSWTRDIIAPVIFTLSVHIMRTVKKHRRLRLFALMGIVAAMTIGLWSGQKATIVNYLLAAFVFSAVNSAAMVRVLSKVLPLALLMIIFTFAITQPSLFARGSDSSELTRQMYLSITNRILTMPLQVAAIYVYSVDDLHLVRPVDAAPKYSFIPTHGTESIESVIGLAFFYQGIESSHSNSLAFAYAYVLAGYLGCLLGGIAMVGLLKLAVIIVKSGGSLFLFTAYSAYLCYLLIDILGANYLQYLLNNLILAIILWVVGSVMPRRQVVPLHPQLQS